MNDDRPLMCYNELAQGTKYDLRDTKASQRKRVFFESTRFILDRTLIL